MAKSKYDTVVKPKLDVVEGWCRDGLTMEQIASNLAISKTTFYKYAKEHSELSELLKKGKDVADYKVENELYKKTQGYTVKVKKPIKVKEVIYENGKKKKEIEKIEVVEQEQYYPAELGAQIFWLKNRRPDKWKDKIPEDKDKEESETGVVILTPVVEEHDNE